MSPNLRYKFMNDAALAVARASKNFLATRIEMPFQPLEGHHTHHLSRQLRCNGSVQRPYDDWFFHRPVKLVASVKVWSCTRSANPGAIPKSAGTNTISDVLSHPLNKKVDEIFNPTYLRGVIAYAKVPVGMR